MLQQADLNTTARVKEGYGLLGVSMTSCLTAGSLGPLHPQGSHRVSTYSFKTLLTSELICAIRFTSTGMCVGVKTI